MPEIKEDVLELIEKLEGLFGELKEGLQELKEGQRELKTEIKELKEEISGFKKWQREMDEWKENISEEVGILFRRYKVRDNCFTSKLTFRRPYIKKYSISGNKWGY